MEIKKRTGIRSMQYEEFTNNDYLERMVRRLNADGAGVIVGTADELINWGRSNSLWSLTFGTSCCAIEFMALGAARYDMARFGFEVTRNSPRQADMIMVLGTITQLQRKIKVERFLGGVNRKETEEKPLKEEK